MKKLRITVEGKVYDVSVEFLDGDEVITTQGRPAATQFSATNYTNPVSSVGISAPSVSSAPSASAPAPDGAVVSPLSGKVVSIDVKQGAEVSIGDQLVTIEAMKMNTFINAPKAGKVVEISVSPGDGVEEGQTLLIIA
ncbi:MAG: biotin/lipoyl-containing protein [Verrucomicrobiia bacterium]